jgi:hypothetical protein
MSVFKIEKGTLFGHILENCAKTIIKQHNQFFTTFMIKIRRIKSTLMDFGKKLQKDHVWKLQDVKKVRGAFWVVKRCQNLWNTL